MLTLGIETSCDDTGLALLEGSRNVLAEVLSSQTEIHAPYGGVVPEVASRMHEEKFLPLLIKLLESAQIKDPSKEIDLIAITVGPGLMGSLLVGVMSAKGLAQAWGVPIVGVNHLEGHIFANVMAHESLCPPFLSLVVSGGHTEIYLVRDYGDYELLGKTRDDAAGECYDKVAKILGLSYPGGPVIDKLAEKGDPLAFKFPVPLSSSDEVEFSFSGLKTAVLWTIKKLKAEGKSFPIEDLCASFQKAVVTSLLGKVRLAVKKTGIKKVAISGGVSANSGLRAALKEDGDIEAFIPPIRMCTDNGAMIAAAGFSKYMRGEVDKLDINPNPSLRL